MAVRNSMKAPFNGVDTNCNVEILKNDPNSLGGPCNQSHIPINKIPNNNPRISMRWNYITQKRASRCMKILPYNFVAVETLNGVSFPILKKYELSETTYLYTPHILIYIIRIYFSLIHVAVLRDPLDLCLSLLQHEKRQATWDILHNRTFEEAILSLNNNQLIRYHCSNIMVKSYTGCIE